MVSYEFILLKSEKAALIRLNNGLNCTGFNGLIYTEPLLIAFNLCKGAGFIVFHDLIKDSFTKSLR